MKKEYIKNLCQVTADEDKALKLVTENEDGTQTIIYCTKACGTEQNVDRYIEVPLAEKEAYEEEERKKQEAEMQSMQE